MKRKFIKHWKPTPDCLAKYKNCILVGDEGLIGELEGYTGTPSDFVFVGSEIAVRWYGIQNILWTHCNNEEELLKTLRDNRSLFSELYPIDFEMSKGIKHIEALEDAQQSHKDAYLESVERLMSERAALRVKSKNLENLKTLLIKFPEEFSMQGDNIFITIKNVVAEDTDADGEDIELGDLVYRVSLNDHRNVYIVGGENPSVGYGNVTAYHPHQISSMGTLCFGTASADVARALNEYDYNALAILLREFSEMYTSSDDAGMYWKSFHPDYEDDLNTVELPNGDRIHEDDARWCNRYEEYYYYDDVTYSEYYDDCIPNDEVVWTSWDDPIWDDWAVELEDGTYLPQDHPDLVEVNEKYYDSDNSNEILWCSRTGGWIHEDDAVEIDGERFHKDHMTDEEKLDEIPTDSTNTNNMNIAI